jgi:hypothetical protein
LSPITSLARWRPQTTTVLNLEQDCQGFDIVHLDLSTADLRLTPKFLKSQWQFKLHPSWLTSIRPFTHCNYWVHVFAMWAYMWCTVSIGMMFTAFLKSTRWVVGVQIFMLGVPIILHGVFNEQPFYADVYMPADFYTR